MTFDSSVMPMKSCGAVVGAVVSGAAVSSVTRVVDAMSFWAEVSAVLGLLLLLYCEM